MSLPAAVESFEPRSPERPDGDGGTTTEPTCECVSEHRAIIANAQVGYYADRGAELATDLAAVGAPSDLVQAAREGHFDEDQDDRATAPGETLAVPDEPGETLGTGASPAGVTWPPAANPAVPATGTPTPPTE